MRRSPPSPRRESRGSAVADDHGRRLARRMSRLRSMPETKVWSARVAGMIGLGLLFLACSSSTVGTGPSGDDDGEDGGTDAGVVTGDDAAVGDDATADDDDDASTSDSSIGAGDDAARRDDAGPCAPVAPPTTYTFHEPVNVGSVCTADQVTDYVSQVRQRGDDRQLRHLPQRQRQRPVLRVPAHSADRLALGRHRPERGRHPERERGGLHRDAGLLGQRPGLRSERRVAHAVHGGRVRSGLLRLVHLR